MPRFDSKTRATDVVAGADLSDRSIIVTGANTGIGFETARALASAGARVVLACRSEERGGRAHERILSAHPSARVEVRPVDLASLSSVEAFCAGIERVDVIVCNAGLFLPTYEETEDGIEKTVGVSHVGHFAVVTRLLPLLRASSDARVVVLSSESHRSPKQLDFDRFPLTRDRYRDLIAYGQAKLCNVLFANELTRRHGSEGVFANSLHPGTLIETDISRSSLKAKIAQLVAKPFSKSLDQGAATSVYCAIAPELRGVGGRYYRDCGEHPMSAGARDEAAARRLWELTESWVRRAGPDPS